MSVENLVSTGESTSKVEQPPTRNLKIGATVGSITSLACFGYGVRSAWIQARPMKANELKKYQLLSGLGFATRALTLATIITCSGYSLFVFSLSLALDVSTPSEFGNKMRSLFGNRFRIKGSDNRGVEFADIFKES